MCPETCINPPYNGVASPAVPVNGPASVGTSVCITGCSSVNGLESYSFTPSSRGDPPVARKLPPWSSAFSGRFGVVGVLLGNRLRSLARRDGIRSRLGENRDRAETKARDEKRYLQRTYLRGLTAWVLVWTPLAFLALLPSMSTAVPALPFAVVLGGVLGSILGFVYHHAIRARLAYSHGVTEGDLLGTPSWTGRIRVRPGPTFSGQLLRLRELDRGGRRHSPSPGPCWSSEIPRPPASPFDVGSSTFSMAPGSLLLLAVLVGFIGLRALYHIELASAANAEVDEVAARVRRPATAHGNIPGPGRAPSYSQ